MNLVDRSIMLDRNSAAASPLADAEVVERVRSGDTAAFELIMRRYNQRLFRVARSIVGHDMEAEDVVQEAYISAFTNLHQFQGRSAFSTWLTKIAVYAASRRQRKQQFLRRATTEFAMNPMTNQSQPDAATEASRRELDNVLAQAVDALPDDLRTVFTLRMVEQMDTDEVAECLELTPANIKVRLHRAKLRLRSWIDNQIGHEARQLYMFDGQRCDRIVANVLARIS
jgi:RNA polymerase sigma-70 factor (ECF subfamily)